MPPRNEPRESPLGPPRKTLAHACLNTPGWGAEGETSFGRKLLTREFQVTMGTITRMRGSYAAAIRAIPPP